VDSIGPIVWVVERAEVQRNDTGRTTAFLKRLISESDLALAHEERIDLTFSGYDDDPRELFEIEEVRTFVRTLDDSFPFWFFFLSKSGRGLTVVALSLLPPFLTDEARKREHSRRLCEIIENRWGPALTCSCLFQSGRTSE
jgi:hypothetical protein